MQHRKLLVGIDLGVDAVQLKQIQGIHLQLAQAQFGLLAQVFGAAHGDPLVGSGPGKPDFGGDPQTLGVRMQRLGDDFLADVRAVGVGGVDEVHSQFDGPTDDGDGGVPVGGLAPYAVPDDAHGPETQAPDGAKVFQLNRFGQLTGQYILACLDFACLDFACLDFACHAGGNTGHAAGIPLPRSTPAPWVLAVNLDARTGFAGNVR